MSIFPPRDPKGYVLMAKVGEDEYLNDSPFKPPFGDGLVTVKFYRRLTIRERFEWMGRERVRQALPFLSELSEQAH
jgi:hypothetical protein